jgi:two-component system nitrate/nitrite response regulator NarL
VTRFVEVAVLAQAARAVAAAMAGENEQVRTLFRNAERLVVWDPVLCALRASPELARQAASDPVVQPMLKQLLHRAGDNSLARQVGLQTRNNDVPDSLLSPRELEVLGLMARGMRNKEIAAALFVAESTIKVHVRHILEKLGVQSRSAAVARFERTARD